MLGPDSSVAPLIFAAIVPLLVTDDPAEAVALAGMLALMVGAIEVGLGLGKLGFVADLLSKEVQVGYMNGLAITIIVGQLPKLFGFSTDADGFIEEVRAFLEGLDQTNTTALAIGLATLAVLLLLPRVTEDPRGAGRGPGCHGGDRRPRPGGQGRRRRWAAAAGVAEPDLPVGAARVPGTAAGRVLRHRARLPDRPDRHLGELRRAEGGERQPQPGDDRDGWRQHRRGLFQGFAVSASGSRTAVAEQSGAKSQVTGLVGAGVVALMLLLFPTLLQNLPQPALAAVVIVAALSLFDGPILRTYYRMRRSAFVIATVTSLGVILFGVLEGILIAVVLSILLFFKRSWWPEGEVLGQVEDLDGWHSTSRYPEAEQMDEVVVYRWDAPLFFANAGIFRQEILTLVNSRQPRWVVLQCEAITDIDVTAADMLEQLDNQLNSRGINIVFVEMHGNVQDVLERYGLFATLTGSTSTRRWTWPSVGSRRRPAPAERSGRPDPHLSRDAHGRPGPDGPGPGRRLTRRRGQTPAVASARPDATACANAAWSRSFWSA